MLKVYNTLGRKIEEFKPLVPGKVSMYVCGPTVYDLLHVGNFRGPVFFNFVKNWLEYSGFQVTYALNFTDVDDKIINRANEEKKTAQEISELYISEYKKDFLSLGLKSHDVNPKVSEHMPQIISFITDLVEKKKAYIMDGVSAGNQDVNFSIVDFKEYGKLSGRKPEDLQSGVRIDVNEKKKSPLDFALWKSAKASEPSWPSPWGAGRPGWHIECSAMIKSIFGEQIDIHGGGLDLLFPHHENEVAQSEACIDKTFVKYWMHWNMIEFGGTKMSKSLGNIIPLRDFLKDHHSEIYKWLMITPHYRSTMDFSKETIDLSIAALARVYSALALAESIGGSAGGKDENYAKELDQAWKQIETALNDDFSTPAAFAVMFDMIRKFNSQFRRGMKATDQQMAKAYQFKEFIKKFGSMMSLFQQPAAEFLTELDNKLLAKMNLKRADVEKMVQERAKVREAKDFTQADVLRKKLTDLGILVSDLPTGSFWEVSK